jgi:hypothetical protein
MCCMHSKNKLQIERQAKVVIITLGGLYFFIFSKPNIFH